jgi:Carboxypeptidase regulatory-like domain
MQGLHRFAFFTFVLVLLVMPARAAFAQSAGSMSGIVQDPSGSSVPGAHITVKNLETNAEYQTVSSESGNFSFPSLVAGNYELKVAANGFRPSLVAQVAVHVGVIASVRVPLELESTAEQITVLADGHQAINTVSAELNAIVDRRQMSDLPTAGREAMSLLRLQAGVAVPSGIDHLAGLIHGLRGNMTNITRDGINIQDNIQRGSLFAIGRPTLDEIAEFSIALGTINLESGTGAAQVKMVTRSGTNEFHGSLFEFHRNKALNANSFFNNQSGTSKAAQIENRFGGSVGGPMVIPNVYSGRDRTFFFAAIEVSREPGEASRERTVWTPDARNGIFKYVGANGSLQQVNLLQIAPHFKTINPITSDLLNQTPLPNSGNEGDGRNTQGYRFLSKAMNKGQRVAVRIDHKLSERALGGQHWLEIVMTDRRVLNRPDIDRNLDAAFPSGQFRYFDARTNLAAVAIHSTFGPHTYNELRVGMHRPPAWFARESDDPRGWTIQFPIGNSPQEPTELTSYSNSPVYQLTDNFSLVKRNHRFNFGGEVRSTSASLWDLRGTVPSIALGSHPENSDGLLKSMFPGLINDSDFTNAQRHYAMLVGLLNSASRTFNVGNLEKTPSFVPGASSYRLERYRELNLYITDQWNWRPNFSWNFGLRYELVFPPSIVSGGALMPEELDGLRVMSGRSGAIYPNLVLAGPREGRPFWNLDKNNFAPFVGFAYQPHLRSGIGRWLLGEGTTSIRGGYTISYTRDGFSVMDQVLMANQGLQQTVSTPPLVGVLTDTGVPIEIPGFKIPISDTETYERTNGMGGFSAYDRNLRTPYVQQWSFGIERELPGRIAIEARYVGNHAQALLRGANLNEVDIFENGFLQEFQNARRNLELNGGTSFQPGGPGTLPLPIFSTLFAGLPSGVGFTNTGFIQQLNIGEAGGLASELANSRTFRDNRANLPANLFKPYPNLNFARYTSNASHSTYNALHLETRRRVTTGLLIQTNYTFSKTLTDGETPGVDNYRTLRNRSIEKHRADWDITHTFNANYLYDLPTGPGRRFSSNSAFIGKLLEGWQISGLVSWHTSPYKTFTSRRLTVNQVAKMMPVPIGNAVETIRRNIGVFRTPQGVFWINPELLNIAVDATTGLATSSRLKPGLFRHPEAGEIGYLGEGMFKSPRFFQADFSLIKKTRVSETANVEFRAEFFNFFNNANFIVPQANLDLDSSQFGRITDTYPARLVQLTMRVTW